MRMGHFRFGTAVSAALALGTGCIPGLFAYQPKDAIDVPVPAARRTAAVPASGEVAAALPESTPPRERAAGRMIGGLSMGFIMGDGRGPGGDLTFTYQFDDFVGIRFSVGHYALSDAYHEERFTPIFVRAVFATPMKHSRDHRTFAGLGVGVVFSELGGYAPGAYVPSYLADGPRDDVYLLEFGREHVIDSSRKARMQVGAIFSQSMEGLSFSFGMDFGG